jgi:hypothetical protein
MIRRAHSEPLRLLATQRDRRAVDPKLERIAAERRTQKRELGTLYEAKHHEPLHGSIGSVDRLDAHAVAGFQISERQIGSNSSDANKNRYYM